MARRFSLIAAPLLALALTACGQTAPMGPLAPQSALVAQETSLPQLESSYRALDWNTQAARKGQLLMAIANTGGDDAGSFLLGEYGAISWSAAGRKVLVLDALDALVQLDLQTTAAQGMQAESWFHLHRPSFSALQHIASVLKGDRQVPAADKGKVDQVLAHIDIVAPHTSR
ncbi:MAG TPA: hypothetical protein V6D47_09130 [Oscillatoriaceae cyanobacterium]